MKFYGKILFILVSIFWFSLSFAESVVVITNEKNMQSLSIEDIKGIYTDNLIQWDNGASIKVYDLPVKREAREKFSQKVLGTSARAAAKAWANRKITNTAKNPPKTKKQKLVVAAVKKNKYAIGYVNESAIKGKSGIKVILKID